MTQIIRAGVYDTAQVPPRWELLIYAYAQLSASVTR